MKMKLRAYLPLLLVLFLVFSFVVSTAAVPTSRSLKSIKEHTSVQDLLVQDAMDMGSDGEVLEEGFMEGRMLMESTDYPGTGANNHHDPKAPGRV